MNDIFFGIAYTAAAAALTAAARSVRKYLIGKDGRRDD